MAFQKARKRIPRAAVGVALVGIVGILLLVRYYYICNFRAPERNAAQAEQLLDAARKAELPKVMTCVDIQIAYAALTPNHWNAYVLFFVQSTLSYEEIESQLQSGEIYLSESCTPLKAITDTTFLSLSPSLSNERQEFYPTEPPGVDYHYVLYTIEPVYDVRDRQLKAGIKP